MTKQSPDARKRMGLVITCVCVLFSLLQIHWARSIGCGELGDRWSRGRCGMRASPSVPFLMGSACLGGEVRN